MKSTTRNFLILTLGVALGVGLVQGRYVLAEKDQAAEPVLPLNELRIFTEVFARIKTDYVEAVDDKKLLESAIRGMLSGLDPHSAYLNLDEYKELRIGTTGEFGGLGIEVSMEDGFVKVVSPIDDTPAQRAGVQAGDLIVRLDEKPVKGLTLGEAVKIMRGKPGEPIELTIVREGAQKPLKITIVRDVIKVKSVKSRMLEDDFGYLRVTQFQSKTYKNLKDAVARLTDENGGPLKGVVLDLRNNPGGVLSAAVDVSDAFLEEGLVVYTEGRVEDSKLKFSAKPGDLIDGAPLVVLVNGGSASASEIVAGALQDHRRALIVGSRSFGKGSVQTIIPMPNNTAVKFTTARYYTPAGRSIQAEGIEPDIILENVRLTEVEKPVIHAVKEADLSGHLENKTNGNGNGKKNGAKNGKGKKSNNVKDYPLHEALNILKGLVILGSK